MNEPGFDAASIGFHSNPFGPVPFAEMARENEKMAAGLGRETEGAAATAKPGGGNPLLNLLKNRATSLVKIPI
jgi:hypothetical protein